MLSSPARNNFGFLRLLFASSVVIGHAPEMIDGNQSREIVHRIFGTQTLGGLAVMGFFLISGYLITKSFLNSPQLQGYLLKRVLRIYPGFCVAYWICFIIVAPLAGADTSQMGARSFFHAIRRMLFLQVPDIPGVFSGLAYPMLDGPMWTIAYEFRCYLLVILLGVTGLLKKPMAVLATTAALLLLMLLKIDIPLSEHMQEVFGKPSVTIHFFAAFMCGASYFVMRDRLEFTGKAAALCGVCLVLLMFFPITAAAAQMVFGGYILFWFAFQWNSHRLGNIGNPTDISYGVYLYAWPIASLILWWHRGISPVTLALLTLCLASLAGWVSWQLVEKPAQGLKKHWRTFFAGP
jgi:peptidoglycan/LPS O-acetylase OafA/YrhL